MTSCKSCGAAIVWAKTCERGKSMPLDAQMVIGGNVKLTEGVAVVVRPGDGDHVSHFATCPNANKHRKPKPGAHDGVPVRIEVKDV